MIFNFFKKNIFSIIFLFIVFITATIFIYNSKVSYSAENNCCYNECNIGTSKCVYNVAFKCCPDCDSDIYQDWCAPDCINPDGQDCTLTGQTCIDGVCTDSCIPLLTCSDYPNKCGNNLSNGCTNILDCSANCSLPEVCSSGNCICPDLDGDGHTDQLCGGDDCQDTGTDANKRYTGNTEVCDGIDNDCDNTTADDSGESAPLNYSQNGVCEFSVKSCGGAAGWQNDYSGVLNNEWPTETSCDGLDNNCDGTTDEGCTCVNGATQDCGSDIGECQKGTQTCSSGSWGSCVDETEPVAEICDELDNDCDGIIDNDCSPEDKVLCSLLLPLRDTLNDASTILNSCLNDASDNAIVELPPGKYYIKNQIVIAKPLTVRTQGKDETMPKCSYENDHDCAELIAAPGLNEINGLLKVEGNISANIDHLVFNGNKKNRTDTASGNFCSAGDNRYGYNIVMASSNGSGVTNSVSKNALCASGLGIGGDNIEISNNTIAFNGVHNQQGLWADGITFWDGSDNVVKDNEFINNTDIDLIFGGCQNCIIQGNTITHTDSFEGSTFAALMIHAWTTTSGNYTDSDISNNIIDCGESKRCGFGLLIGSDPWYITDVYGGSVHDNSIKNVKQGFVIDDAYDMSVYNITVENFGGNTVASCGTRATNDYNIGNRSYNITASNPSIYEYTNQNWDGCIPNWWEQSTTDVNDAQFISQSVPTVVNVNQGYEATVIMKNIGTKTWSKVDGIKLGSQNSQDNTIWGANRVELNEGEHIAHGQTKTFIFTFMSPLVPGEYNFQWKMVQEGVEWFGNLSENVVIENQNITGCTDECSLGSFGCEGLNNEWTCGDADDGDDCLDKVITACDVGAGETCNAVSGKCESASTENTKLLLKYFNNQIFLIADDNWQEVMSLVSLTTWTAQDSSEYSSCHHVYNGASNVCVYPTLIYHKEAADVYDADSILHFIDQYSANSVTAVNNPPTELTGHINGKGITLDIISINDYLSYWSNYDEVVYVQNNYQLALIASTFASLKNAPLVVQGTSLDAAGTFSGKTVYTVGSLVCPASASSCVNFANVQALEQEYFNLANTDKLILVNYDDLNLQLNSVLQPYHSSNNINNIYANQSLSAPILASAKHELIISTNATDYINVDSFIEGKQISLSINPKYLTIIAYPDAIQMSEYNMQPYSLDDSMYNEVDNSIYADTDHNDYPDMAVGRLFSISTSDISSNICRSLFYQDIPHSNNFSMLWPNYFQSHKMQAKSNDMLLTAAGLNQESIYYDEGYSSMNINRDMKDKFIINYLDHSNQAGYHDTVYSNSLLNNNIQMHPSIIVSDSCMTCAYKKANTNYKNQLFCSRIIRQGALAHLGGVEEIYIGRSGSFSKMFIESILSGETFGNAIKKIKVENVIMRGRPSNSWNNELTLVLIGDPTFAINPMYPLVNKTNVTEDIINKTVELSIPKVSTIFDSDVLWPSTKNNIQAYIPPFGVEVSDYVTTWDPSSASSPYAQPSYFMAIDENYLISDIVSVVLIKENGDEETINLTNHPLLYHVVYQDIDLNSFIKINKIVVKAESDDINNQHYVRIKESYRFSQPYSNSFGTPIPAHSYRITFN